MSQQEEQEQEEEEEEEEIEKKEANVKYFNDYVIFKLDSKELKYNEVYVEDKYIPIYFLLYNILTTTTSNHQISDPKSTITTYVGNYHSLGIEGALEKSVSMIKQVKERPKNEKLFRYKQGIQIYYSLIYFLNDTMQKKNISNLLITSFIAKYMPGFPGNEQNEVIPWASTRINNGSTNC